MRALTIWLWITFSACFVSIPLHGQSNLLQKQVKFVHQSGVDTRVEYLDYIAKELGITFSYNASQDINLKKDIDIKQFSGNLDGLIQEIFKPIKVVARQSGEKKIILTFDLSGSELEAKIELIKLSGIVIDSMDGTKVAGALVVETKSNKVAVTDENGQFSMYLPPGNTNITIQYIGYRPIQHDVRLSKATNITAFMSHNLTIPEIVIDGTSRVNLLTSGEIIDLFRKKNTFSITGSKDVLSSAKSTPGVQSGGEGQSGLYVRGGSPDQNLIMIDGVALYEASHSVGLSSIFIDESINSASLIKNGFPARYGGRLSSVLDVKLKNGDLKKHHRTIGIGLPGAMVHFDGPMGNGKTSYNIGAKTSWINQYINKVFTPYTKYDKLGIGYHDIVGKINHQFNERSSLSASFYKGGDKISLTKSDVFISRADTLNTFDNNQLFWSTTLFSLKYQHVINDQWIVKAQAGYLDFISGNRSSYQFVKSSPTTTNRDELDVLSYSYINDINVRVDADYYVTPNHTIRLGANQILHRLNPAVKQSNVILDGDISNIVDKDSTRSASELNLYIEDNYKLGKKLFIYVGFHLATYNLESSARYSSLQPRINIIWSPSSRHVITGAYSEMAQFAHLISNSGLGLPTSVWVPSTANVSPELSRQWSLKYDFNISKTLYTSVGGFIKRFDNILEFTKPLELFYFLINNQTIAPVFNNNRDWERNAISGQGISQGIETLIHKRLGLTTGWLGITYSKSERLFAGLNDGKVFPANFDRTWDINGNISRQLSKKWSVGAQFVYGSGRYFTLSSEEYDSFLGIKLINVSDRNNYRLPPFHQLSLNASYQHQLNDKTNGTLDITLYNVYNRLNPYFIYVYKDIEQNRDLGKKVSILPILPSINYTIRF